MLELNAQKCVVTNVNPRAEKHGTEIVSGCDINLKTDISADVLETIAPGLKKAMYKKPLGGRQGELVEGAAPGEGMELRFAGALEALRLCKEYVGYAAKIVWGDLAGTITIDLESCRVHRFVADLKPGGSCELAFQIQCRPGMTEMGELCTLIQREVAITLTAPQAEDQE